MSLFGRKKIAAEDVRRELMAHGATETETLAIEGTLTEVMSAAKAQQWLFDPKRSHPIEDPDAAERFEKQRLASVPIYGGAASFIEAGRADVVLDAAVDHAARERG